MHVVQFCDYALPDDSGQQERAYTGHSFVCFLTYFQAQNKETQVFAALKQVDINSEEDLEDFSVEINILAECVHRNVVGLHEAFFFEGKLWVSS